MFKHIYPLLTLLCAALGLAACSESNEAPRPQSGEGRMVMHVAAPQVPDGYDPLQHLKIEVFNLKGEVVRRFDPAPTEGVELKLLAGEYRIVAEAGESGKSEEKGFADFTRRKYRGEKNFTLTAGETSEIEVVCKLDNVVTVVSFDESVAANFDKGYHATVADDTEYSQERVDQGRVAALRFTADGTGYFDLLEGEHTLAWQFSGRHPQKGLVEQRGLIEQVTQPGRYNLSFKYSPSAPGFVECFLIRVDPDSPEFDDTIIFNPGLTITGEGFDLHQCQEYRDEEKSFVITGTKAIGTLQLGYGEQLTDLLSAPTTGVRVERESDLKIKVTLTPAFFATLGAGNHTLTFHAADTAGSTATEQVLFRLRGFLRPTAADYDLWHNTLTLRYVVFDSETAPVEFGLREKGATGWQTLSASKDETGICSVTFSPEWLESKNEAGLTVYRAKAATGIFARHTYECYGNSETEGIVEFTTDCSQEIPFHDMESPTLPAFLKDNGSSTSWASGNNNFTPSLCTQGQADGSHVAQLNSSFYIMALASGNLFLGNFVTQGTGGSANFGQSYEWQARPQSLKVRYNAQIGTVDCTRHKLNGADPIPNGQPDKGRIMVAIVDWSARHSVASSLKEVKGAWDPANITEVSEGKIIGYGSLFIEGKSEGEALQSVEIPIHYYDTRIKPSARIQLVISCAASAYGDFMNGCKSNVMRVDDFEWGY